MKKQTKVLVAAAMLTLGASFSAMAAQKGTWDNSTGEWMCYDKEGDAYEEEWCLYNGQELWVDEDGILASSVWVEGEDGYRYYALSDGAKLKANWKDMFAMDDEEADEVSTFYFDAKGRMATGQKTIDDVVYYFDEEGRMLTGWVAKVERYVYENGAIKMKDGKAVTTTTFEAADTDLYAETQDAKNIIAHDKNGNDLITIYYATEDGPRADKYWVNGFAWFEDADELYEDEMSWFYITSGAPKTNTKADSEAGYTYFFDADGKMMSGWIGYDKKSKTYSEINEDNAIGKDVTKFTDVYYAGDNDYASKSEWEKVYAPDDDDNKDWFYFDKNGKLYRPEKTTNSNATVTFVNGDYDLTEAFTSSNANTAEKRIDGVKYLFNDRGEMLYGLVNVDDKLYYYGSADQGTMQTGAQVIEDKDGYEYKFYFAKETTEDGYTKGVAVNGNADGYCYKNGLLQTSNDSGVYREVTVKVGVKDYTFVVDYNGQIQHKNSKKYELEDGTIKQYTFDGKLDDAKEDSVIGKGTVVTE